MNDKNSVLEFISVSKLYKSKISTVDALSNVSFSVKQGEIFGMVGESGAGKSTLLNIAVGLEKPTGGTAKLFGQNLDDNLSNKTLRSLQQRLGIVFQGESLVPNLTIDKNLRLGLKISPKNKVSSFAVEEILEFVGLSSKISNYPAELSGGQRQRVAIARALINKPDLILLDEPTSALDNSTREDILQLLLDTRSEFGTSIVVVSHEIEAIKRICDRAALLEKGNLKEIVQVKPALTGSPLPYLEYVKKFLADD